MKYQAYPEYKDSGVEWLGDVPEHWSARQLKFLCTCNDEVLPDSISADYEIEYVDIGSVSANEGITRTESLVFGSAPSRARRIVRDGDVIVSTVRTYLEAIAPIDNPPENLVVSTGFAVIRPNDYLYKGFAAYCLRANGFIKEVVALSVGVSYPAINASDLVNIKVPEPLIEEQQKIANFLDHETAKIDTLIQKQQQLIKLLKEKRQAVISHAVTKGLNPNAPMRDSGVEWLGEVPEHWKVCRIKQVAKLESGHTPDKKIESYWVECDIPWVSLNDSSQLKVVDYISETAIFLNEKGIANSSARKLPGRCVVFTRDASIGLAAITTRVMAVSQHVIAWICDEEKVIPEYLLLVFYAMKDELDRFTFGATLKTIGMPDVNKLTGSFPDIVEQKIIIEHVFRVKQTMDIVVSKAEEAIKIIQERRTALISAAVTGKIDVRNWQAPEPLHNNNEISKEETA
jgi:type I restriction enzyme S subunit